MRAIILAAGRGERLGALGKAIPKPMLKVRGRPILEHNIKWLRNYGIRDIYLNLHHLPEVIKSYFGDGDRLGVKITYSYEPELLGTAGGVRKIADECWQFQVNRYSPSVTPKGLSDKEKQIENSAFLVIYGDNLFEYDLRKIIDYHERKKGIATIAIYEKDDIDQSGVVVLDCHNRITEFIEKPNPQEATSHLVNTGIYVLEPEVLKYISPGKASDFGKDVFPKMIGRGEDIFGLIVKGNLIAIDTPEFLNAALSERRRAYH